MTLLNWLYFCHHAFIKLNLKKSCLPNYRGASDNPHPTWIQASRESNLVTGLIFALLAIANREELRNCIVESICEHFYFLLGFSRVFLMIKICYLFSWWNNLAKHYALNHIAHTRNFRLFVVSSKYNICTVFSGV